MPRLKLATGDSATIFDSSTANGDVENDKERKAENESIRNHKKNYRQPSPHEGAARAGIRDVITRHRLMSGGP